MAVAYQDSLRRAALELAVQARLLQRLWQESAEQDREFVHGEVAGWAHLSPVTAGHRLTEALLIAGSPQLLAGLEEGRLTVAQAGALVRQLEPLDPTLHEPLLDRVLGASDAERADRCDGDGFQARTPGELTGAARRALIALDADAAAARRRKAQRDRTGVRVSQDHDGLAVLNVTGQASVILRAYASIRARAAATPFSDQTGQQLTQGQRELAALLHALDCASTTTVQAVLECPVTRAATQAPGTVDVRMSIATALGLADDPAELTGHGPIDPDAARALLPAADLVQALVDATTGEVLTVHPPVRAHTWQRRPDRPDRPDRAGRQHRRHRPLEPEEVAAALQDELIAMASSGGTLQDQAEPGYTPSAALGRLVDLRDVTSVFPGDLTPARRTDRDHRDPWPHGPTSAANLQNLTRRWHRAKHTSWTCTLLDDGTLRWTSPRGNTYTRRPKRNPPPTLTKTLTRAWRPAAAA